MGLRLVWQPRPLCPALYAISVRQLETLPGKVNRFPLPSGFLQIPPRGGHPCLRLALPTTKCAVDFHHQAIAHGGRTTVKSADLLHFQICTFLYSIQLRISVFLRSKSGDNLHCATPAAMSCCHRFAHWLRYHCKSGHSAYGSHFRWS